MSRMSSRSLVVLLLALIATSPIQAKGKTVRLSVAGDGLAAPVEITESAALANVWGATGGGCSGPSAFFGQPVAAPSDSLARYRVTFHVKTDRSESVSVEPMYVVGYAFDPATSKGFVYFPAKSEDGYALNSGSIVRDAHAGNWYEASPAWSAAISSRLR